MIIHSQAKRHAYNHAAGNCERLEAQQVACLSEVEEHRRRIDELEDERANIAKELENIRTTPELAGKYQQLEEMKNNVAAFESALTEEEQKISGKKRKELGAKSQQVQHVCDELNKQVNHFEVKKKP